MLLRATSRTASMGPRLKDVEDAGYSDGVGSRHPRFNGATSQGRGRLAKERKAVEEVQASMGPRLKDVEDTGCSGVGMKK